VGRTVLQDLGDPMVLQAQILLKVHEVQDLQFLHVLPRNHLAQMAHLAHLVPMALAVPAHQCRHARRQDPMVLMVQTVLLVPDHQIALAHQMSQKVQEGLPHHEVQRALLYPILLVAREVQMAPMVLEGQQDLEVLPGRSLHFRLQDLRVQRAQMDRSVLLVLIVRLGLSRPWIRMGRKVLTLLEVQKVPSCQPRQVDQ